MRPINHYRPKKDIEKHLRFFKEGTFESFYEAGHWLSENGYSCGSTSCMSPVAIRKGEYDLPQKWHNLSKEEIDSVDGIMFSSNFREGEVEIYIYK